MGLIEKLQARLELYRLEQRYTRREKRTTFNSAAQYVDGEYVYASSSSSPGSSSAKSSTTSATNSWRFSKAPVIRVQERRRAS